MRRRGLLQLLDGTQREWRADVIAACTEMGAGIRSEMADMRAGLRREMADMGAGLRREMMVMGRDLRLEMASGRVELLKWCFLFWVGQVVAIGGLMGVMLRLVR